LRNDTGENFDAPNYSLNVASMPEHADLVKSLFNELKNAINNWY
jgi:hypothetical protein